MSWDITDIDIITAHQKAFWLQISWSAELSHQCRLGLIRALTDTAEQLAVGYTFPLYPPGQPLPPVFMLAETGVLAWTKDESVITACIDSDHSLVQQMFLNKLFVSHALEYVADKVGFLSEIWRRLKGEGELVMIVPHRRSL